MNDTDIQATNTDYKPKLHKNDKLVLQVWLVNNKVVPGSAIYVDPETHLTQQNQDVRYGVVERQMMTRGAVSNLLVQS